MTTQQQTIPPPTILPSAIKTDEPESRPAGGGLSARAVWHALRRSWLAVAAVVALAGAAAAGVWFFLPLSKMTAYAILQVSSQPTAVIAPTADSKVDFKVYRQAQAGMIKSRVVLNAALSRTTKEFAGVAVKDLPMVRAGWPDGLTWLENKLTVDFRLGPEFMKVAIEGDSPEEMTAIVAGVTEAYLERVADADKTKRRERLKLLEKARTRYEKDLATCRDRLRDIAEVLGVGATNSQAAVFQQELAQARLLQIRQMLVETQSKLLQLQAAGRVADPKAADPEADPKDAPADEVAVPEDVIQAAINADPYVQKERGRISTLRAQVKGIERVAVDPKNPDLVRKRGEVEQAEKALDKHIGEELRPDLIKRYKEAVALQRAEDKRKAAGEVAYHKRMEKSLLEQLGKLAERTKDINRGQFNIEPIRQQIALNERAFERVEKEIDDLKLEIDAPGRVSVMEPPTAVPGIEGNKRVKFTGMAGGGVLFLGLGLIVWWDVRKRRIVSADEVSGGLGLKVVGTLPALPRGGSGPAAEAEMQDWQLALAESIDTTRTMLLHGTPAATPVRTILVSSATGGEGKTSLASHLATSLARAGYRTVLVDGDMRRPAAHRVFDVAMGPGLSEVLRREATADDVLRPTPVPGLMLLPAGLWDARATQALSGDGWRVLRDELLGRFDYVVVDSSPLLPVVDTLLLARDVDGVLLAVLQNVSQMAAVAEASKRLGMLGVRNLGVVVNGVYSDVYRTAYTRVPRVLSLGNEQTTAS